MTETENIRKELEENLTQLKQIASAFEKRVDVIVKYLDNHQGYSEGDNEEIDSMIRENISKEDQIKDLLKKIQKIDQLDHSGKIEDPCIHEMLKNNVVFVKLLFLTMCKHVLTVFSFRTKL